MRVRRRVSLPDAYAQRYIDEGGDTFPMCSSAAPPHTNDVGEAEPLPLDHKPDQCRFDGRDASRSDCVVIASGVPESPEWQRSGID